MKTKMKRLVIEALCVAMFVTLLAGCDDGVIGTIDVPTSSPNASTDAPTETPATPTSTNTSNEHRDDDFPMSQILDSVAVFYKNPGKQSLEWPSDAFQYSFPEYDDGEIVYAEPQEENDMLLIIEGSSKQEFERYKNELARMGWALLDDFDGIYIMNYTFDAAYMIALSFIDEYGYVIIYGFNAGGLPTANDWPAYLPFPMVVYTDGTLVSAIYEDDCLIAQIENTSKSAVDVYSRKLLELGWNDASRQSNPPDNFYLKNDQGEWQLTLYMSSASSLRIMVVKQPTGPEWYEPWPEWLPVDIPVYTECSELSYTIGDDAYFFSITGTTRAAVDKYEVELLYSGWQSWDSDNFYETFRIYGDEIWEINFEFDETTGSLQIALLKQIGVTLPGGGIKYTNEKFNFTLMIPQTWEGLYRAEETNSGVNFISISNEAAGLGGFVFGILTATDMSPEDFDARYMMTINGLNYFWTEPHDVQFVHGGTLEDEYRLMESDVKQVVGTLTITS